MKDLMAFLYLFGVPYAVWHAINFILNSLGISIYYGDEGQFRYADGVVFFLCILLLINTRLLKSELELELEEIAEERRRGAISEWRKY